MKIAIHSQVLTSVIIGNSVTSINAGAFRFCTSLEKITISKSVTQIGPSAFFGCYMLKTIYYAGKKDEWESVLIEFDNDDLTAATIHYNYTPEE